MGLLLGIDCPPNAFIELQTKSFTDYSKLMKKGEKYIIFKKTYNVSSIVSDDISGIGPEILFPPSQLQLDVLSKVKENGY